MARNILTDKQWERLHPLLPPQKPPTGRPSKDHRTVLSAILWILRTGAPWRDLPRGYGSWQTIASRFYRWVKAGVWIRVLEELQRQADAEGNLDWSLHHVDGTVIRAHQHAAGAQKGDYYDHRQSDEGRLPRRSVGTKSGRLQHQDPSARRGQRKAARLAPNGRTATRAERVRDPDGDGRGQAGGARPTACASRAGGQGQGLQ